MAVTTALYPGSFDPIHRGHLSIVERAAASFDRVVVAVLGNPAKRSGMFDIDERVRLVDACTPANVAGLAFDGLTVDAATAVGADVILRSAHKEQADELTMAWTNERLSGVTTMFVAPDPETTYISASLVRSLVERDRLDAVRRMVPESVFAALTSRVG